jgi:uncharacterized membrane protein
MHHHHSEKHQNSPAEHIATSLGWFSIGLGLAQLIFPRQLAQLIGVRHYPGLFGALGLREITSGIGILTQRKPAAWLWARVAGDAMDLALLGAAVARGPEEKERVEGAIAAVAGVTILDGYCAMQLADSNAGNERSIHVSRSITIDRSPEELYWFWRDFENLPRFMRHLVSVKATSEWRSHWVAKAPAGGTVEWDAEITSEQPGQLIAWRSLPGSEVDNAGSVSFEAAPGGRGTYVRVNLEYNPPGGLLGALVAKFFGEAPDQQIQADLYRLKQLIETGQVTTTEGQPAGRSRSTSGMYDTEITKG